MSTNTPSSITRRSDENNTHKKRKHGGDADGELDVTSQKRAPSALEEEIAALRAELQAKQRRIDNLTAAAAIGIASTNANADDTNMAIPRVSEGTEVSTLKKDPDGVSKKELLQSVSGRPAAHYVLPRITEDMDVTELRREAWERGWPVRDISTKEELLPFIGVGSISLAGVKNLMDMEKKAANKEPPIEHAAADIFAEHGLEFLQLVERIYSLAFVSKDMHRHCVNQFEAEFRPRMPALVESIARSPCSSGQRFTFGRVNRFLDAPGRPGSLTWPSLKLPDLTEIDVLIQIEDVRNFDEDGANKVLGYAVGRLQYDPATRDLFSNAQCEHFDFQIPLYKPQEADHFDGLDGLGDLDASDHWKSLAHACARKSCLKCANCNRTTDLSLPCLRPSSTLLARVVLRHRNSGKMAQIILDAQPHAWGENENDSVGSYGISFKTALNFTAFGVVKADLQFRLFSEERKDTNNFIFSTRPFRSSPENDPQMPGLPSYCQMGRSERFSRLTFSMWTPERDSFPGDEDSSHFSDDEDHPRTKCLLQALRNYVWA